MCHVARGHFTAASREFEALLRHDAHHTALHQYAFAKILWQQLDSSDASTSLDALVHADIKHGATKQLPATQAMVEAAAAIDRLTCEQATIDVTPAGQPSASMLVTDLLRAAHLFGSRMQVRVSGFVANRRLQRQAGLATLDMAQRVRRLWAQGSANQGVSHGWRAILDIAVRWRQLGEPNDNVWWIDGMPTRDFQEGFGSHTPIVKGQYEAPRYYVQYKRVFKTMKALAAEQWQLDEDQMGALAAAKDCLALRRLRGRDDYVVHPCYGVVGGKLEGTRLTVQDRPPEGIELSIRTPLTPTRWEAFDSEMQAAWAHLCKVVADRIGFRAMGASLPSPLDEAVIDAVLRMCFYWYNFMPLTRGTAAVGWTMLMALLLACGHEVSEQAPEGVCLDWEAILTPSLVEFTSRTREWLLPMCKPCTSVVDELPQVAEVMGSFRTMLEALNCAYDDE